MRDKPFSVPYGPGARDPLDSALIEGHSETPDHCPYEQIPESVSDSWVKVKAVKIKESRATIV